MRAKSMFTLIFRDIALLINAQRQNLNEIKKQQFLFN